MAEKYTFWNDPINVREAAEWSLEPDQFKTARDMDSARHALWGHLLRKRFGDLPAQAIQATHEVVGNVMGQSKEDKATDVINNAIGRGTYSLDTEDAKSVIKSMIESGEIRQPIDLTSKMSEKERLRYIDALRRDEPDLTRLARIRD